MLLNILISNPKNAHETKKKYSDPMSSCMGYWTYKAKENNESFEADHYRNYYREIRPIQLNTAKRYIAYDRYLRALSGSVFSLTPDLKSACEFDNNGNLRWNHEKDIINFNVKPKPKNVYQHKNNFILYTLK